MYETIHHYLAAHGKILLEQRTGNSFGAGYQLSKTGQRAIYNIKPQPVILSFKECQKRINAEMDYWELHRRVSYLSSKFRQMLLDNIKPITESMQSLNLKFGVYDVKGKALNTHSSANDVHYMALFDTLEEAQEWYENQVNACSPKLIKHLKSSAQSVTKLLTKFSDDVNKFLENTFEKNIDGFYVGNNVLIAYNHYYEQIYVKKNTGEVLITFDIDLIDIGMLIKHLALYA